MLTSKRLEPGKWYIEYDEKGEAVRVVHDRSYCRILGYASEQEYNETGATWISTIHPDDAARVDSMMKKVKRKHPGGLDFDIEYRRMTRTGYRWFHDYGRCTRREDGSLKSIDGVIFDIQSTVDREDAHQALIDNNMRILALEDQFESLYEVDLETGRYEMYIKGQTLGDISSRMVNNSDFFADTLENVDRVVYYDDREGVRNVLTAAYIRKALEQNRYFDWYYRLLVNTGNVWVRMRILYKNADRTHIIVGVFNAEEAMTARRQEERRIMELAISRFRTETLAYVADNDPDPARFMEFFGSRFLQLTGCDQVMFRSAEGRRYVLNAPGIEEIPQEICAGCPFARMDSALYAEDGCVLMDDCRTGVNGTLTHPDCPAKSSFMQQVWTDGRLAGLLTVHYVRKPHVFVDVEIDMMKDVAAYMGLLISRISAKKAEREKLEAQSANRAKTEFLFNMSHDIRTPMNAVLGFTGMAMKHLDDREKVRECLEKTQQAGQLLLGLINSILDMSRVESGSTSVDEQPGDVYLSFANFDNIMRQMADSRGIDLSFEFGPVRDRYVYCDFTLCNRVFVNIISNSIKYTREGGYVKVRCEQTGSEPGRGIYRYTVSDNGVGMSEEFREHVFEQFSREHTSTNTVTQGTGLGMAVCKSFVELMGGTVTCESSQGEGTTFTVTLPFRLQEGQIYTDPQSGETVCSKSRPRPEIPDFTGRKVLLVEDNELNREIASEILEDEGFIVDTVCDGRESVERLKEKGPDWYDFVIMDIQMPVMNGYEATRAIRAMYPEARIPVIALSANAFEEDRRLSREAGMDAHVAKPINLSELLGVMAGLLRRA